jgi:hypothetical protein
MSHSIVLLAIWWTFCGVSTARAEDLNREQGRIIVAETMCPEVEFPVCATKNGQRKTYGNDCKARRDGATDIKPGACEATK